MARTIKDRTTTFLLQLKEIHQDKYDASKVEYINAKTPIILICKIHGSFSVLPSNIISLKRGCQMCSSINRRLTPKIIDTKTFKIKAVIVHGTKYIYDLVNYISTHELLDIVCPEHGVFKQSATNHCAGSGCPECAKNSIKYKLTYTNEEFIARAKEVHGDKYRYSNTQYINSYQPVTITCIAHGDFSIQSSNFLAGCGCLKCNSTISKGVTKINEWLTANNIAYTTEQKFPKLISSKGNSLRLDFYISSLSIAIEFNGHFHYQSIMGSDLETQQSNDLIKKQFCMENNIKLISIPYWDANNISKILNYAILQK